MKKIAQKLFLSLIVLLCPTLAAAQGSWNNGGSVSLPTTLSAPGVFTNTQQNENFTITLNGPCTYSDFTSTSILTDGFSTCIIIPSSGVTNAFTNGIAAYVKNTNSNTTGQNGYVGGVGVYAQALCTAGGSAHCWGMNPSVIDVSGFPGTLFGEEVDVTATNTTTTGFGVLAAMLGSAQPTLDHFPAFYINTKAGSNFTTGFETQNGSISSSNGFAYGSVGTQLASTNPSHSQLLLFNGRNASGTALQCGIELLASSTGDTTDGTMGFGQCPLQTTGLYAAGTQSVTGCSLTSALGGPWAGSFHSGTTGTCTVTITPKPATNGYACKAQDMTTPADVINQTATNSTTATLSGTTASGDVITWSCIAF